MSVKHSEQTPDHGDALVGSFVRARAKTWLVETVEAVHENPLVHLVSVDDDSQGETLRITLAPEIGIEVLDPQDYSPLLRTSFDGPDRLGAFLRAAEWRTASAADRKLFQAPVPRRHPSR